MKENQIFIRQSNRIQEVNSNKITEKQAEVYLKIKAIEFLEQKQDELELETISTKKKLTDNQKQHKGIEERT